MTLRDLRWMLSAYPDGMQGVEVFILHNGEYTPIRWVLATPPDCHGGEQDDGAILLAGNPSGDPEGYILADDLPTAEGERRRQEGGAA